jgi:Arc/MetJ family transcription regulator
MQTTVSLDDALMESAEEYTGISEPSALLQEALRAHVEREAARQLIAMGGSDPAAEAPPRRRPS